jgi:hypothetical protein
MVAKEPPGHSPFDEYNWEPSDLRIVNVPDMSWLSMEIKAAWDSEESYEHKFCAKYGSKALKCVWW